jgi:hypothetical protein
MDHAGERITRIKDDGAIELMILIAEGALELPPDQPPRKGGSHKVLACGFRLQPEEPTKSGSAARNPNSADTTTVKSGRVG